MEKKISCSRSRSICLPIVEQIDYEQLVLDAKAFRQYLDHIYALYPDVFPKEINGGYHLEGFSRSKKHFLSIRRIRIVKTTEIYQIQPIMFEQINSLAAKLFPCAFRSNQLKDIITNTEVLARKLNDLPPVETCAVPIDQITQMQSICLLLEQAIDCKENIQIQPEPIQQDIHLISENNEVANNIEISATAKELIKVRDWVLLAKSGDRQISPQILEDIYGQLEQLLTIENVTVIEEDGICNYERHRVLGTEPTDDPNKEDIIHSTVRPGYLFSNKLIRPQEVIVYTQD